MSQVPLPQLALVIRDQIHPELLRFDQLVEATKVTTDRNYLVVRIHHPCLPCPSLDPLRMAPEHKIIESYFFGRPGRNKPHTYLLILKPTFASWLQLSMISFTNFLRERMASSSLSAPVSLQRSPIFRVGYGANETGHLKFHNSHPLKMFIALKNDPMQNFRSIRHDKGMSQRCQCAIF